MQLWFVKRRNYSLNLNVYAAVTAGLGSSLSHENRTQAIDKRRQQSLYRC